MKPEVNLLLHLRNVQSLQYHEIAAQLGRSASSIKARYTKARRGDENTKKNTSAGRRFTAEDDAKMIEMRKDGRSMTEIAANFPRRTIPAIQGRVWLLREHTGGPRRRTSVERMQLVGDLIQSRDSGLSWKEIAQQYPDTPLTTLKTYHSKENQHRRA